MTKGTMPLDDCPRDTVPIPTATSATVRPVTHNLMDIPFDCGEQKANRAHTGRLRGRFMRPCNYMLTTRPSNPTKVGFHLRSGVVQCRRTEIRYRRSTNPRGFTSLTQEE